MSGTILFDGVCNLCNGFVRFVIARLSSEGGGVFIRGLSFVRSELNGRDVFSAAVVVVLATTMMTPPLLRAAFGREPEQRIPVEESIAHAPARGLDRSPHRTMTRMLRGAEVRDELRRLLRER